VLTSDASGLVSWQTPASSGSQATLDVTPIPVGTTGTYTPDYNALKICQFGTCCPPWKDCDGDTKTYQAGTDCDEGCATCYVGSAAYTASPDGKDQDCDGVVDEEVIFYTNTPVVQGYNCDQRCATLGKTCFSIGNNSPDYNNGTWVVMTLLYDGEYYCGDAITTGKTCSSTVPSAGSCSGVISGTCKCRSVVFYQ
jgi:hypothetical protein